MMVNASQVGLQRLKSHLSVCSFPWCKCSQDADFRPCTQSWRWIFRLTPAPSLPGNIAGPGLNSVSRMFLFSSALHPYTTVCSLFGSADILEDVKLLKFYLFNREHMMV